MELLKNLNQQELEALRGRFAAADNDALDIDEFEAVISDACANKPHINVASLHLRDLFNDIDVNGDLTVSWDEFSMFLINSDALSTTTAKSAGEALIQQYRPSGTTELDVPGSIAQVFYVGEPLNVVVKIIEREKHYRVKLCHPEGAMPVCMEARIDSAILSCVYIPSTPKVNYSNVIAVAANDSSVRFFDIIKSALPSGGGGAGGGGGDPPASSSGQPAAPTKPSSEKGGGGQLSSTR